MPKSTARAAVLTAVLALTLTGCAGSAESAGDASTAPETNAPLVAETPETPDGDDVDAAFVEDVRKALSNGRETSIPDATDEQLLEAGYEACAQLADGVPDTEVQVVENEIPSDLYGEHPESYIIATVASTRIC